MSTLRLEEKPFLLEGKVYSLRCNMAVLDALQEAHGGDFGEVMSLPTRDACAEILAAMLNDYAEDMGWEEHWTPRAIKKRFSYAYLLSQDILGLFTRGVLPAKDEAAESKGTADGAAPAGSAGN